MARVIYCSKTQISYSNIVTNVLACEQINERAINRSVKCERHGKHRNDALYRERAVTYEWMINHETMAGVSGRPRLCVAQSPLANIGWLPGRSSINHESAMRAVCVPNSAEDRVRTAINKTHLRPSTGARGDHRL